MILSFRSISALIAMVALVSPMVSMAQASPPACAFKPDELAKVFGVKFGDGKEEPGIGGSSCKYSTVGGSLKAGTDFSIWLLVIKPGGDQDMIGKMTIGPNKGSEPVAGDPDGATRIVRDVKESGVLDVTYKRKGHLVILRSLQREGQAQFVAKLLQLPRVP